ncbi:MAG: hypothetical protein C4K49_06340 [Candidatus Thorarchaeota archaeon]|nr:MAG: hypothetical protein C4K49_06340 [Candidatus Thorarchaeota archaeon]
MLIYNVGGNHLQEVFVMAILDTVEGLLKSVGIKYSRDPKVITMRWKTDHFEDLKVKIVTNNDESWVYIVAPFTSVNQVEESVKQKFLYDMLKESWKANGVKYGIDNDDDIIVISETNDTDLTSQEVQQLINHVVHACDTLWEIYPS